MTKRSIRKRSAGLISDSCSNSPLPEAASRSRCNWLCCWQEPIHRITLEIGQRETFPLTADTNRLRFSVDETDCLLIGKVPDGPHPEASMPRMRYLYPMGYRANAGSTETRDLLHHSGFAQYVEAGVPRTGRWLNHAGKSNAKPPLSVPVSQSQD